MKVPKGVPTALEKAGGVGAAAALDAPPAGSVLTSHGATGSSSPPPPGCSWAGNGHWASKLAKSAGSVASCALPGGGAACCGQPVSWLASASGSAACCRCPPDDCCWCPSLDCRCGGSASPSSSGHKGARAAAAVRTSLRAAALASSSDQRQAATTLSTADVPLLQTCRCTSRQQGIRLPVSICIATLSTDLPAAWCHDLKHVPAFDVGLHCWFVCGPPAPGHQS